MSTAPLTKGEDDLATIIQAYNDVTEQLKVSHEMLRGEVCRLRDELHEKNKELQRRERLAALGEMAAGVAHEIRNPLGGIGLYASLLGRDLKDRPEQLKIADRIGDGVRNLDSIVGDILAFAGDAPPNRSRTLVTDILAAAGEQATPRADGLSARLTVATPDTAIELNCDTGQIERALLNLLLNALDAAGKDGRVHCTAEETVDEDHVCRITVEDDGPGIPSEQLQRVFNPFFTTKDTGTGLGLAIVHRIAEAHGGRITAGNRPQGGAVFVLSIPMQPEGRMTKDTGGDE